MRRKKAESSASNVSVSSHSDGGNKSRNIATGAARVFNSIVLKSLPSTIKSPAKANSTSFQILHAPDRSPVEMPLSGFPTNNDEFDEAISRLKAQAKLSDSNDSVGHRSASASASAVRGTPQSTHSPSTIPGTAVASSPGSTSMFLGPRGNGPLDNPGRGADVSAPIPAPRGSAMAMPFSRRVASDGVPPRPLSERPLIYSSVRTRPSLQTMHGTASTPNVHSALRSSASGIKGGYSRITSGGGNGHRPARRPTSADSTVSSSCEDTDSFGKATRHGVLSARDIRDSLLKTKGSEPVAVQQKNICYLCQEDCQPGDNLCSNCRTRFQPQGDVFEYSGSEYEDDTEVDEAPHLSPVSGQPQASPRSSRRSSRRRNTRYRRPGEKSRDWSELSPVSQLQQLASRSASSSPTPRVALELKVIPPQDIKIRTVVSPAKTSPGDGRSAFHRIQQAMKPSEPMSPGRQGRNSIRLGKMRPGEIRRVDILDIIKAEPPTPNEKSFQVDPEEQHWQNQRRGSFENLLKYYDEDGGASSERHSGPARSDRADVRPTGGENIAAPATPGTYDRVTSIYDLYASLDDA